MFESCQLSNLIFVIDTCLIRFDVVFQYTEDRQIDQPVLPKIPTDDTHDKVDITHRENNQASGDNSKSMKVDPFGKDHLSINDDITGTDNSAFEASSMTAKVTEL